MVECCLLGLLSLLCEFDVVLIEDDLLDLISGDLLHEQALRVTLLVALDDFILETEELEDLLEHGWRY